MQLCSNKNNFYMIKNMLNNHFNIVPFTYRLYIGAVTASQTMCVLRKPATTSAWICRK